MLTKSAEDTTRWQYVGDSFAAFVNTINRFYPWEGAQGDPGKPFHWLLNLAQLTAGDRHDCRLMFGHLATSSGFSHAQIPGSPDIAAVFPVYGRLILHFSDGPVEVAAGNGIIYQVTNLLRTEHFVDDAGRYETNYLEMGFACAKAYFSQVLHFPADRNLFLQSYIRLDNPRGQMLARVIATMAARSFAEESRDFSPSLQQRVVETFSQLLLESVQHRYSGRTQSTRLGPMPGHVRLARDYMQKYVLDDPNVADIAAAAGVSLRTMETAFRAFMDITPTAYMRTLRLRLARDALLAGDPRSIAELGKAFGFAHTGRFAGYYADLFGESPSDTRRDRARN